MPFSEAKRYAGGRGIPKTLDIARNLCGRNAQPACDCIDDSAIPLVWNEPVDIRDSSLIACEQGGSDGGQAFDGRSKYCRTILDHAVLARGDGFERRWSPASARGYVEQALIDWIGEAEAVNDAGIVVLCGPPTASRSRRLLRCNMNRRFLAACARQQVSANEG